MSKMPTTRIGRPAYVGGAMLVVAAFVACYSFFAAAAHSRPLVILVRHGDAPGSGEPNGFTLGRCDTQRNLSDKGRQQASAIGAELFALGIDVTKVMASELCRTEQTAELMNIGPVESAPAFNDFADFRQKANELVSREQKIIEDWHGPGALVIVTHGSNIKKLTGLQVDPGAMIITKFEADHVVAWAF